MGDRLIYLIRHGEIDYPCSERTCIGYSSAGLSMQGARDAENIGRWLENHHISSIYTSPYRRCINTAQIIAEQMGSVPISIDEDLREIDTGDWNGKTFTEIKASDYDNYIKRGNNLGYYPIPGGESFYIAERRFDMAINQIARKEEDNNILIVSHSGVIRAWICHMLGISLNDLMKIPQPYCGITRIQNNKIISFGERPEELLDEKEIQRLYKIAGTPFNVIIHMRAVRDYLEKVLIQIDANKIIYNHERLYKAALLHDLMRMKPKHAEEGANFIRERGYSKIAELVADHHKGEDIIRDHISDKDLLFYTDKRVQGSNIVTISERFERSLSKCKTEEAISSNRNQMKRAMRIERMLESFCICI